MTLSMHNDTVRDAVIRGDFFGNVPVEELERALCGKTLAQIRKNAAEFAPARYIFGMDEAALIALFDF